MLHNLFLLVQTFRSLLIGKDVLMLHCVSDKFLSKFISKWIDEASALANVLITHPHTSYCAFAHGLIDCWVYIMRKLPDIGLLLKPLEDVEAYPF